MKGKSGQDHSIIIKKKWEMKGRREGHKHPAGENDDRVSPQHADSLPSPCPPSDTAEEKGESALSGPPTSLPLTPHFSVLLLPHLRSVTLCSAVRRGKNQQLHPPSTTEEHAGRSCCFTQS